MDKQAATVSLLDLTLSRSGGNYGFAVNLEYDYKNCKEREVGTLIFKAW